MNTTPVVKASEQQRKRSGSWAYITAIALALALCLGWAAVPAAAQTGGDGSITGTVVDSKGRVVTKASVSALNVATGVVTTRPTTSSGDYDISPLTPGTYTVTVTAGGFKVFKQENVAVDAVLAVGLNVTLTVGSESETVLVTAAPPTLETTNATMGGVIENSVYTELPIMMSGGGASIGQQRDITQFSNLLPGAQVPGGGRSSIINGTAQRLGELYLDGIPTTNVTTQGDNRPVFNIIPLESVDQIQVLTAGVPAEYQGAGTENYTLKSGGNTFHGAVFEYIKNTAFDAWSFSSKPGGSNVVKKIVNGVLTSVPGPKPAEHQDEYGFTVGGPLRIPHIIDARNKIFFYGSFDRDYYAAAANPSSTSVPTTLMRQGNFSELLAGNNTSGVNYPIYDPSTQAQCTANSTNGPCRYAYGQTYAGTPGPAGNPTGTITNIIPAGEISPEAQYMEKFLPPPNVASPTNGEGLIQSNYLGGYPTEFHNHLYSARVDYNISEKQKVFGAFATGRRLTAAIGILPPIYSTGSQSEVGGDFWEFEHSYTLTTNLINEFKAGYLRWYSITQNQGVHNPLYEASAIGITGLPSGQASTDFPFSAFAGSNAPAAWGGTSNADTTTVNNSITYVDNLLWVKGKHAITAGFTYQFLEDNADTADGNSLPFTLNWSTNETSNLISATNFASGQGYSFASYMIGAVGSSSVTQQPFSILGARYHPFAPYFQDDYKITPKLTLNLGLRWDYIPTYNEVSDRWSFLNPNVTNPITGNLGILQTAGSWAGSGSTGPTGTSLGTRTPISNYFKNFGPRLGFAYSVTPKLVARGGFAVLYTHAGGTGGNSGAYNGTGQTGFTATPPSIADSTSGPAFYLNSSNSEFGGPGTVLPTPAPISAATQVLNTGNFVCGGQLGAPASCVTGSWAGAGGAVSYPDPYLGGRAPEIDFYNFGLQYEVFRDLVVSANYVGSQAHFLQVSAARGLQSGQILPSYAPLANVGGTVDAVSGSTGGTNYLADKATQANINAAQTATGITLPIPYPGYPLAAAAKGATSTISIQHMLTWMPQYSGTTDTWGDVGNASYNAFQFTVQKRLSHGLAVTANYTYSKNIDDAGTFRVGYAVPASETLSGKAYPVDRIDRSLSVNDVPNLLSIFGSYKLPFGKDGIGQGNGFVRAIASGWLLSSVYQYGSGLPLPITGTCASTNSLCQGTAMPDINPNYHANPRHGGKMGTGMTAATLGTISYITGYIPVTSPGAGLGSTAKTSTSPEVDVPCAASTGPFCNPGAGMIGDAPRVAPFGLRLDGQGRLGGHIGRTFDITERWKFVFSADGQNLLNHVTFGNDAQNTGGSFFGASMNSSNFGAPLYASNDTRQFQFSGRLQF
jgi:hypothetical protein